jgi:hypothetical protein
MLENMQRVITHGGRVAGWQIGRDGQKGIGRDAENHIGRQRATYEVRPRDRTTGS